MSATSPNAKLSPRAARTRAALLEAGLKLLARHSIDAISVDELVSAAHVAKGSFFNHFADKAAYADAVYAVVRGELEAAVTRANEQVTDPLERLSGGMTVAAAFALAKPDRFAVMLRTARGITASEHPLNAGVANDVRLCVREGVIRPDARRSGVTFWLGCCQMLMVTIAEQRLTPERTVDLLSDMLRLALLGLGASERAISRFVEKPALRAKLYAS